MKKVFLFCAAIAALAFSSCTSSTIELENGNPHVEFYKGDFTLSKQVSAEATSTRILSIDFSRLFTTEVAYQAGKSSVPIIGNIINDPTASYALYKLLQENPGYDVIFYPQYQTKVVKPIGLGGIYSISTCKVTAKLGKMK